ncbi:MAG: hypothetical protein GX184_05980 [Clostridiaceae bacterium]|nr:hypothetical protein [Clostridiaceae bacterium]
MSQNTPVYFERRKGPDLILRLVRISSIILWGFIILNFFVIFSAKPEFESFFDRLLGLTVRENWDYRLLSISLVTSLIQLILSVFALFLNTRRLKRKTDRISPSIIISLVFSAFFTVFLSVVTLR